LAKVGLRQNLTTQTSTPKFVEEVVAKVMQVNEVVELFQTMVSVNLNMGNLEYGGEQSEKRINHRKEREGNIARGIGQGKGL
jgi:hypothetical protein